MMRCCKRTAKQMGQAMIICGCSCCWCVNYTGTNDAMIARLFVAPSAVDIERVDLSAPFHSLFQLFLCVVDLPLASLQKPHQSASTATAPSTVGLVINDGERPTNNAQPAVAGVCIYHAYEYSLNNKTSRLTWAKRCAPQRFTFWSAVIYIRFDR